MFSGTTGKAINADADGKIGGSIAIGTNPAQSGALRLANNQAITARNAANDADLRVTHVDSGNTLRVGNTSGAVIIDGYPTIVNYPLDALDWLRISFYCELKEMTAPAAPPPNLVRIYAEDNGAGKTRLMVRFATGAAVQIAIEP